MAEKKPGLLKRIFSFGFGNKQVEEEEASAEDAAKKAVEEETLKEPVQEEVKIPEPEPEPEPEPAKPAKKKKPAKKEKPTKKTQKNAAPAPQKAELAEEPIAEVDDTGLEEIETAALGPVEDEEPEELAKEFEEEDYEVADLSNIKEIEAKPVTPSSGEMTVTLTERKASQEPEPEPEPQEERKSGWLKRLTKGLSRSSNALTENITKVFTDKKLDDDTLQDLEDILIQADLGVETAMKITDALSAQKFGKTVTDQEVREVMAEEIEKILAPVAKDLDLDLEHQPHVMLMIGVNGSGKTTTIGKLSQKLYDAGFSTSLIAGDTFRAAAIEQLQIWGERTQSPVLSRPLGADAAGLAYDAWEMTREERRDVMLMDTAGRLQNRTELMQELEKIVRVLKKQDPAAPHTVLLTLDATTGQNALSQVEIFKDVAGVNGLVMTKLDGTARGGILVAIAAKYKLPVYFIGVGEQVEDLEPFEARDFARSIAGLPKEEDT